MIDLELRIPVILLCFGLSAFFLLKRPSALGLLGVTALGLGHAPVYGGLHYGTVLVLMQLGAAGVLAARVIREKKVFAFFNQFRPCLNLYSACLILIWLEIASACFFDMNPYRVESLKSAVFSTWIPILLMTLATQLQTPEEWCQGIIWGLVGYATVYVFPLIPGMYLEQRLQTALAGGERLTTFLQDTINGDHMFYMGTIGCGAMYVMWKGPRAVKIVFVGAGMLFFILMILNGTRQYLLSLAAFALIYIFRMAVKHKAELVVASCIAGLFMIVAPALLNNSSATMRFSVDEIASEAQVGRGEIWQRAFFTSCEHPFMGLGFRNFGDDVITMDLETKELMMCRDCAHGFFQTIASEHGIIICLVTFVGALLAMKKYVSALQPNQTEKFGFLAFVASSMLAENFSCAVFNAFGYHLLLLAPILFDKLAVKEAPDKSMPEPIKINYPEPFGVGFR